MGEEPLTLETLGARMRQIEHFHKSRLEETIILTSRVQLLEDLVAELAGAYEEDRLDELGALLARYRNRRDDRDPQCMSINRPPPLPPRVSLVRARTFTNRQVAIDACADSDHTNK